MARSAKSKAQGSIKQTALDSPLHAQLQELRTANESNESTKNNGTSDPSKPLLPKSRRRSSISVAVADHPTIVELVVCIAGIYISFLTWALLQERITTTPYGPEKRRFKYHLVLLAVQSLFASAVGYLYILFLSRQHPTLQRLIVFPNRTITSYYFLVSISTSLAAPFGYAALAHIDYITFILAKSCKLLPVMLLHITLYQRRFPLYKYVVVLLITAGVAVFTLYNQSSSGSSKKHKGSETSSLWGLFLLGVNLFLDGVTNSTQDYLFASARGLVSGPQMQCGLNVFGFLLTVGWLIVNPWSQELSESWAFVKENPGVANDVVGFALCGAIGQVFIFYTLSRFGSLTLVTVTVTRKMVSMILSVFAFGHSLSPMQWAGVGLVFGGVGAEAEMNRRMKEASKAKVKEAAGIVDGEKKDEKSQ